MGMTAAIATYGLSVSFPSRAGTVHALRSMSFSVERGSVFGFLGPNGAGKTTTMQVLLGFIPPTEGSATILGNDVRTPLARERIGYLPEHPDTYRFLTARELLRFASRIFGIGRTDSKRRTTELLDLLDLSDAADRRIGTYSRGMLQRICLAQALINDPDLVILDEPTGGLDPFGRLRIREIISSLRERGKTVFFSSHELSEIETVCDQVAILGGGRILAQGELQSLVRDDEDLERAFMRIVSGDREQEART